MSAGVALHNRAPRSLSHLSCPSWASSSTTYTTSPTLKVSPSSVTSATCVRLSAPPLGLRVAAPPRCCCLRPPFLAGVAATAGLASGEAAARVLRGGSAARPDARRVTRCSPVATCWSWVTLALGVSSVCSSLLRPLAAGGACCGGGSGGSGSGSAVWVPRRAVGDHARRAPITPAPAPPRRAWWRGRRR